AGSGSAASRPLGTTSSRASAPATLRRLSDAWAPVMSPEVRRHPHPVGPSPRLVAPFPLAGHPSRRGDLVGGVRYRVRIVVGIGVGREADGAADEDMD